MTEEQVKYIKSIKINKLWGNIDIDWQLDPKVNILVGKNGVGKTTLLNIIESVINKNPSDYDFELGELTINLNNAQYIQVSKMYQPSLFDHLPEEYLEKIKTTKDLQVKLRLEQELIAWKKTIKQNMFYFLIEHNISNTNNNLFEYINLSKINTFEILLTDIKQKRNSKYIKTELDFILSDLINDFKSYQLKIKKLIESKVIDLDDEIQRLLNTDNNSEVHSKIIQLFKDKEKITAEINKNKEVFLNLINDLFAETDKTIDFDENNSIIFRKSNDDVITAYQLSSGEKQILIILLKILLQENKPYIVLMDEPELSLHLTWQFKLIDMIQQLNPNCQLIIVTHAPGICSQGWKDKIIKMEDIIKE
jgi:ABC-type lipoprotein export system ATPase subunit